MVGQNLLEIFRDSRSHFYLAGTNCLEDFHGKSELDQFFLSPLTNSEAFIPFLKSCFDSFQPDLIIPCRDEEAVLLAKMSEKDPYLKSKISLTDAGLAEKFEDKFQSHQLCQMLDLPFAKTVLMEKIKEGFDFEFPVIVKPKKGFASKGVRILIKENQLKSLNSQKDFILQEYLGESQNPLSQMEEFQHIGFPLHFSFEEIKYSIQIHLAKRLEDSSWFIGRHLMKNGVSFEVERWVNPDLEQIAKDSLGKFHPLGFRGPLNIQLQRDRNGSFKIFEFNSRFTGATHARYLLGYNELEPVLRDQVGYSPFETPKNSIVKARKVFQTIGISSL